MKTRITFAALLLPVAAFAQWIDGTTSVHTLRKVAIGTTSAIGVVDLKVQAGTQESGTGNNDADFMLETAAANGYAYGRFKILADSTIKGIAAGFFFEEGAGNNSTTGNQMWTMGLNPAANTFTIAGGESASLPARLSIFNNGNVLIGPLLPDTYTAANPPAPPTAKLEVNGNVNVVGDITMTGNINAKYRDLAEWVESAEALAPGTLVILDTTHPDRVTTSQHAYDTTVAGVVSPRPGITLGDPGPNKAMIATTGRVKIKVDATKQAVRIGDLLTTSDLPGHAMKSIMVDIGGMHLHRPGTIVGKALEPLAGGRGEILALLTLQ